jgi:16S rRNA pseudouridine516 synthase
LLLLTNDGELNHRLISPKWHVDKLYFARIDKAVDESDIAAFEKGIVLDDDYECLPAKLQILKAGEEGSEVLVTLQEGKFHQVKRMFQSLEKKVVYLQRVAFGPLKLDESLEEGTYRELTEDELILLKKEAGLEIRV